MAAPLFTLPSGQVRNPDLLAALSLSGLSVVSVQWAAAGDYFLVPQDNNRKYICFSVPIASSPVTISPGEHAYPYGYILQNAELTMEFGGNVMKEIVQSVWRFQATANGTMNIISVRG